MPNTVFKAVVKIPYDTAVQQVAADGSRSGLNVGAVVMLPDGFVIAPQDRLTEELKEETKGVYYTQYSDSQPNILLVGPLPGDEHREIVFPILSLIPPLILRSISVNINCISVATAAAARFIPPAKRAITVPSMLQ